MTTQETGPRMVVPKYNGVAAWDAAADPRQVLRNMKQSEMLTVLEDDGGGWLKVRLPEGIEGFVRRDTVTDFVAAPPSVAQPVVPAAPATQPTAPTAPIPQPVVQPVTTAAPPGGGMQPMTNQIGATSRGFLSRLFDMSLKSFITPSIVRFIFTVWVVLSTLALLIFIVVGFAANPGVGVVLLILSPFIFLLNVIVIRIYMELLVVIFRIEENTRK